MGTPLEEIITTEGVECSECPAATTPFPNGPTPFNPVMSITGYSDGFKWLEVYRREIEAGQELQQQPAPCLWIGTSPRFTWTLSFVGGTVRVGIQLTTGGPNFVFLNITGGLCQDIFVNDLFIPAGNIAFDGFVHITWGDLA